MKKIVVIIPYFGKFPKIFNFWKQSALNNPTVDFLIFTDNQLFSQSNIKVINMTFNKIKEIIQRKFDFSIALSSPYKLCDYRGGYGDFFQDFISGYDFWGFGDIDLVYGDIRHFITDEILEQYDVISGWGHLTLYRNNEFCNHFYKQEHSGFLNYKDVFQNPRNFIFDEYWHGGLSDIWKSLYPNKIWDSRLFDDIQIPSVSMNFVSVFHPEFSNGLIFKYINQKLFRLYIKNNQMIEEETLYAHFQKRNFMKIRTKDSSCYLIIPNKFIPIRTVTLKILKKYAHPQEIKRKIYIHKISLRHKLYKYLRIKLGCLL